MTTAIDDIMESIAMEIEKDRNVVVRLFMDIIEEIINSLHTIILIF